MKTVFIVAFLLCCPRLMFAQQEVPPPHTHGSGICWGYAAVRAYNRLAGAAGISGCSNPSTAYTSSFLSSYFESAGPYRVGYVVQFQNGQHYAYISGLTNGLTETYDESKLLLDQVPSYGGSEQTGLTVTQVGRGSVTGCFKPAANWPFEARNDLAPSHNASGSIKAKRAGEGAYTESSNGAITLSGNAYGSTVMMYASMNGQTYGNYVQLFAHWHPTLGWSSDGYSLEYSPKIDATSSASTNAFKAYFAKGYTCTFVNSFSGGSITVSGGSRSSGYQEVVKESNSISAQALNQTYYYLVYSFTNWTNSKDGNTVSSASTNFTPYDNTTYTANFTVTKATAPPNVSAGGQVGQHVQVTWSEHPSSNVTQYQVWRRVKPPGGELGPLELKATLNRGTTSWTDSEYLVTQGYTDAIVNYAVKSYYSPTQTWSDPEWTGVFARQDQAKVGDHGHENADATSVVSGFSYGVASYPNPFNPSTTIAYELAGDAAVKLEIYDVMGRKVKTLLDGSKSAGYYTVVWNGRDEMGRDVSSGAYLYHFVVVPANGEKIFKQSGKLMLTR